MGLRRCIVCNAQLPMGVGLGENAVDAVAQQRLRSVVSGQKNRNGGLPAPGLYASGLFGRFGNLACFHFFDPTFVAHAVAMTRLEHCVVVAPARLKPLGGKRWFAVSRMPRQLFEQTPDRHTGRHAHKAKMLQLKLTLLGHGVKTQTGRCGHPQKPLCHAAGSHWQPPGHGFVFSLAHVQVKARICHAIWGLHLHFSHVPASSQRLRQSELWVVALSQEHGRAPFHRSALRHGHGGDLMGRDQVSHAILVAQAVRAPASQARQLLAHFFKAFAHHRPNTTFALTAIW